MSQQRYWEQVYRYFKNHGVPRDILNRFCISAAEAAQISTIIQMKHPRILLEIGTFIGLSTGVIALTHAPESTLIVVDPNLPVAVYAWQAGATEQQGALTFVRQMLEHFGRKKSTIVLEGYFSRLSEENQEYLIQQGKDPAKVTIFDEKAMRPYSPIDLVFLDGDHTTDAVYADLCLIHSLLSHDGIIVLHDVSGQWGEQVCAGVASFVKKHPDFSLITDHNLGFLSRDKEKTWLSLQRDPPIEKARRKVATLVGIL